MTARLLPLIVVFAACTPEPSPPPKSADLTIPPLPEAGAPQPAARPPRRAEPEKLSYEEVLQRNANAEPIATTEPDMTDGQLSAPMRNASFIAQCGAPDAMKVTVKVAVQRGLPVGVSVYTNPPDQTVARCVDEHVRTLRWVSKPKLDSFTTTY